MIHQMAILIAMFAADAKCVVTYATAVAKSLAIVQVKLDVSQMLVCVEIDLGCCD